MSVTAKFSITGMDTSARAHLVCGRIRYDVAFSKVKIQRQVRNKI